MTNALFTEEDIISTYTRGQAVADGLMTDVTTIAREAGFSCPVAITAAVDNIVEPSPREIEWGQDREGRLWDVVWMASRAANRAKCGDSQINFMAYFLMESDRQDIKRRNRRSKQYFRLIAGPGDDGKLVLTIDVQRRPTGVSD